MKASIIYTVAVSVVLISTLEIRLGKNSLGKIGNKRANKMNPIFNSNESQNTTVEQMKMFLTRIGFNSKAVITGDVTQIDLPRSTKSGLRHAMEVLSKVSELSFNYFESKDIVRHPVVAKVVQAYEEWEAQDEIHRQEIAAQRRAEREQKVRSENETNLGE